MTVRTATVTVARRGLVLGLVLLLALVFLPIERVVAEEIAPETRSETVSGLPAAGPETTPDTAPDEGTPEDRPAPDARQLSDVVEAPLPFSGLGVTGPAADEDPVIHWRGLLTDGTWSEWRPVPILEVYDGPDPDSGEVPVGADDGWVSDAIWVGAATHLQLDVQGADLDDIDVTFIDTAGLSESLGERTLRRLRSLSTPGGNQAESSVSQPNIISRAGWGADESCTSGTIRYHDVHFTVIHHTASSNNYTEDQAAQQVRNIYHWHTACHGSGNGWNDIGYNFLIDHFGNIYEGRRGGIDKGVQGAHAFEYNAGSFGVGIMGNLNSMAPTSSSLSSLNDLLTWKFHVHGIPTHTSSTTTHNDQTIPRLVGHRNVRGSYDPNPSTTTDCPGQQLYTQLDQVRADLAAGAPRHTGLEPRETTSVKVTGSGVPSSAEAVVLNVTTANATNNTYVSVWPKGTRRPATSTINPRPGQVIANEIIAKVGDDGYVNVYNHNGKTDVILDVVGYLPSSSDYDPITPTRRFDTRASSGGNAPIGAREARSVTVTGSGVPSSAKAVVANVTAVNPTENSFLTVWPHGTTRPTASTLNPRPGLVTANEIIAKVGDDGRINVYNHSGKTDVIVDIVGYLPSSSDYEPITPTRRFDTRESSGGNTPIGTRQTRSVTVTGSGVPSSAESVVVNVTAVNPTLNSFVTVWPHGTTRPATSTLNPRPGLVIANEIIAEVGDDGRINVYNHSGETDIVLDVVGFVPSGSDYEPITPVRRFDTRAGGQQ